MGSTSNSSYSGRTLNCFKDKYFIKDGNVFLFILSLKLLGLKGKRRNKKLSFLKSLS